MERMFVGLSEFKLAPPEEAQMTFTGYGAVFNNLDDNRDMLLPGSFKQTLRESKKAGNWPPMLLQHGGLGLTAQDLVPVGLWAEIDEDDKGLPVKGRLAPTPRGQEVYELMRMEPRPAITGLSIGYRAKDFTFGTKPDEPRRLLKRVDLVEISLVTFPANDLARVRDVKSLDEISSLADAEDFLREVGGLSRAQAVAFIARVKAAANRGDPDAARVTELAEVLRAHVARLRAI